MSDLEKVKKIYGRSLFSVSPGYVGLSITQSFAFGRPMLVAKDEPHAPELEAFQDFKNGMYFNSDDADSLADTMKQMFNEREKWVGEFGNIVDECKSSYSVESMVKGFIDAARK